ncbi:MAG: hypothetical protein AAF614_25550 [Chloroflexota bacterium]
MLTLATASLLLVGWLGWFAVGETPLYLVSGSVTVVDGETLTAVFPAQAQQQIFPGQSAQIRFRGAGGGLLGTQLEALVTEALLQGEDDELLVELHVPFRVENDRLLGNGGNGSGTAVQVAVETARPSPFALLMRVTGQ